MTVEWSRKVPATERQRLWRVRNLAKGLRHTLKGQGGTQRLAREAGLWPWPCGHPAHPLL